MYFGLIRLHEPSRGPPTSPPLAPLIVVSEEVMKGRTFPPKVRQNKTFSL